MLTIYNTKYKQISPTNEEFLGGESILFEWDTVLDVKTNFVITDVETRKIIFKTTINSAAKQYRINQFIAKGKYTWRLEGFEGEMIFVMK